MSARSRSLLPSHLFVNTLSPKKTILYKGTDISSLETDEEILEVQTENGTYRLHRRNLRQTLQQLRDFSSMHIGDLSADMKDNFTNTVEAMLILKKSPDVYPLLVEDVRTYFQDVSSTPVGTVGAYFFACYAEDSTFPGPQGCSPKCLASQPNIGENIEPCEDLILVYDNENLKPLNGQKTPHCYIHVRENFTSLKPHNIEFLQKLQIKFITLVHTTDSGGYTKVEPRTPIAEFIKTDNDTTTSNDNINNNAGIWVVIIVLIIVILAVLLIHKN